MKTARTNPLFPAAELSFSNVFSGTLIVLILTIGGTCRAQPDRVGRVDCSTLNGKVMCGYQGWFNCEGDGAELGWVHWSRDRHKPVGPGNVTVDLWPDMSEYSQEERFATQFRHRDGRQAEVFSSFSRQTVVRHFRWMRQYGIDGAFVQRFATSLRSPTRLLQRNAVLRHARKGAESNGRAFAVMYDLSGLKSGQVSGIQSDWSKLVARDKLTSSTSYLHHNDRPVVSIWGVGFRDGRDYDLSECLATVKWFKKQGCCVMLGVPSFWREGIRDAVQDDLLHEVLESADIVSPWSVGRYRNPETAKRHSETVWANDLAWCRERQLDFLPVVFPGFSWHNLHGDQLDAIPRLKGKFLWAQFTSATSIGCDMIYVAMFDEVDEGTAVFKCTSDPPDFSNAGPSQPKFIGYEGLPSDHYLKLVGAGGKLLRGEIEATTEPVNP